VKLKRIWLFPLVLTALLPLRGQVNIERFVAGVDSSAFLSASQLNIEYKKGNVDFQQISLEHLSRWRLEKQSFLVIYKGELVWENGRRFVAEMLLHGRYMHRLTKGMYGEFFLQSDFNKARLLDSRSLGGAGFRLPGAWGMKNMTLGLSLFFEHEEYGLPSSARHAPRTEAWRGNGYISLAHEIREGLKASFSAYVQPDVSDAGDLKAIAALALDIGITEKWSIALTGDGRYDSRPPDGIREWDVNLDVGINWMIR